MSSIKPCVPCSVVSPKNVFIRENSERIIRSITDPICNGAEGRRVSVTGLLMLWFFVRNLSLSSQADEDGFAERAVSHHVSSENNDDSQRCHMDLLPFSGVYNVFASR